MHYWDRHYFVDSQIICPHVHVMTPRSCAPTLRQLATSNYRDTGTSIRRTSVSLSLPQHPLLILEAVTYPSFGCCCVDLFDPVAI